ncbi:glycosyltransferase family 9 protein [bacterium]|nr:glycosyltransferase family 9 protein [bacterium]
MLSENKRTVPDQDVRFRVLLVKLKHIGDALMMTPAICAIRQCYPNAEITVVVRAGTEGILAGCLAIDHIITASPAESHRRTFSSALGDVRTWLEIRGLRYDYAFELTDGDRGRWLAGMGGARHRCVNTSLYQLNFWWRSWFNQVSDSKWDSGHRVEKDFHAISDFLPLDGEIPRLCFERSRTAEPEIIKDLEDFAVIHPGTRWIKKKWPRESWIKLGKSLLHRVQTIVISCGPDEGERQFARGLVDALGSERVISADGKLGWAELAGMLYRARVFVGVDTAAMHLAAACQCPTVAFFAYSIISQWSPWRVAHELIHLEDDFTLVEIKKLSIKEVMALLTPEKALAAVDRLIRPAIK